MNNQEIKKQLQILKQQVDQLDDWTRQTMNMIYVLEEKLMDEEDIELNKFLYRVL